MWGCVTIPIIVFFYQYGVELDQNNLDELLGPFCKIWEGFQALIPSKTTLLGINLAQVWCGTLKKTSLRESIK